MNKYLNFLLMTVFLIGCSAMHEIKTDYMKGDEAHEGMWTEAFQTLKTDYLGGSAIDKKRIKVIKLTATDVLLKSEYAGQYQAKNPMIDADPGMPEAFNYIFVHFLLNTPKGEVQSTENTFMVVISRFNDRIEYSGIFNKPVGNYFYRYHEILKKIRHGS